MNNDSAIILCFSLFFPVLNYAFKTISYLVGVNEQLLSGLLYFLLYVLFFKYIVNHYKKTAGKLFIVLLVFISVLLINYILFPNNRGFYETTYLELRQTLSVYLPSAVIVSNITDYQKFFFYFRKTTHVAIVTMMFAILIGYFKYFNYMLFGVHLLPFAMGSFYFFYVDHKLKDALFLVISILLVVIYAGRASLLSLLLYFLFVVLTEKNNTSTFQRFIACLYIIFFTIVYLLSWEKIIGIINTLFLSLGFSSRNLESLISGNAVDMLYRDHYYEIIKNIIYSSKTTMYGLFGDRYLLSLYYSNAAYVHNIILEIQIAFGYYFGNVIIIFLIYKIIHAYFKTDFFKKQVIILFVCLVVPRLLVSSSFIIEDNFYLLLGVIFGKINKKM